MSPILEKINSWIGVRQQPDPTPTQPQPVEKTEAISGNNRLLIWSVAALAGIGLLLFGLRQISTTLRGRQLVPGDPNLNKTVKMTNTKASIVTSIEQEINQQDLNEQHTSDSDVQLVSKRFHYKPLGTLKSRKLVDTNTTAKLLPAVVAPVSLESGAAKKQRVIVKTVYIKPKQTGKTEEDDPFNTVHVATTSVAPPTQDRTIHTDQIGTGNRPENVRFIPASIYGNQKIRTGQKARFRVTESVTFMGVYIPRNTILSAVAYLGSGRIQFQLGAPIIAGQKLPTDLMCVDRDYQLGITFNYDYVDDNIRQVGSNTATETADAVTNALPYGTTAGAAGRIGTQTIRGITSAVASGRRQKSLAQVEIQDGYQVYFKSSKQ